MPWLPSCLRESVSPHFVYSYVIVFGFLPLMSLRVCHLKISNVQTFKTNRNPSRFLFACGREVSLSGWGQAMSSG